MVSVNAPIYKHVLGHHHSAVSVTWMRKHPFNLEDLWINIRYVGPQPWSSGIDFSGG